jgi:hypothetical protein
MQELEQECLKKDSELEGLRAWKKDMYTFMGRPSPESAPAQRVSTYQHDLDVQTGATRGVTKTAMDHLADASFSSSSQVSWEGSTPKRSKLRPSSKDLSAHMTNNNTSTISKTFSNRSKANRSALQPISPNRRHTAVGVPANERKDEEEGRRSLPLRKRRGSSQGSEEVDFDMAFAGSGRFATGAGTWRQ